MTTRTYIEVKIATDEIRKTLLSCLDKNNPHRELIATTIMEHLKITDMGLEQLFNAFSGLKPSVHVKIGDTVLVKYNNLPSWRMNEERMRNAGMIYRDTYIKGEVHSIDLLRKDSVCFKFTYLPNEGDAHSDTYYVNPELVVQATEEYPENLGDGF